MLPDNLTLIQREYRNSVFKLKSGDMELPRVSQFLALIETLD